MNYSKHLDEKIAKANQGIGVIKRLYNYLPRKVLLQIYISYIRPNLDYCDVIYHTPSHDDFYCACYYERAKTDRVRQSNTLPVAFAVHLEKSSELGLTSLYDRNRLSLYYKILNNLTPEYLRILIPDSIRRSYAMRNDRGKVLPARTQKYRYSFFPDASNASNLLSSVIKSSPSLTIFKKRFMNSI